MLAKAPPTTSRLDLVNAESVDGAVTDGIKMADLVESLDTRELDIDEGEDVDYEGNCLGTQWVGLLLGIHRYDFFFSTSNIYTHIYNIVALLTF